MKKWINSLIELFFPRCCVVCADPLSDNEEYLCIKCNMHLPRTNYHLQKDNEVEKLFWGQIPIEKGSSFFFYNKGSDYRNILYDLKYRGCKELGETMGRYMAAELSDSGFFQDIDFIIPVPLHQRRLRKRGYNQSEWIALGIHHVTGLPLITNAIVREKHTESQTSKSVFERRENVDNIFALKDAKLCRGKHILIVDDVLTTGATINACASVLGEINDVRITVLTLAVAK